MNPPPPPPYAVYQYQYQNPPPPSGEFSARGPPAAPPAPRLPRTPGSSPAVRPEGDIEERQGEVSKTPNILLLFFVELISRDKINMPCLSFIT